MKTLSLEQMKHLKELGLNINEHASFGWVEVSDDGHQISDTYIEFADECDFDYCTPAYCLHDMIDLFSANGLYFILRNYQEIQCSLYKINNETMPPVLVGSANGETELESAYNMVVYCIENNFIKTSK